MDPPEFLNPLIRRRRSLRAIDSARPVPMDVLERLLEAARWAPSSGNAQSWRFVLATAGDPLERARAALSPGNQAWATAAPVLAAVCADPSEDREQFGQPLYMLHAGLATENLLLQAVEEGLVAHAMAGWDEDAMRAALSLPLHLRVTVVVAIGYPGGIPALPPDLQARETGSRRRKPLTEIARLNGWEVGWPVEE